MVDVDIFIVVVVAHTRSTTIIFYHNTHTLFFPPFDRWTKGSKLDLCCKKKKKKLKDKSYSDTRNYRLKREKIMSALFFYFMIYRFFIRWDAIHLVSDIVKVMHKEKNVVIVKFLLLFVFLSPSCRRTKKNFSLSLCLSLFV